MKNFGRFWKLVFNETGGLVFGAVSVVGGILAIVLQGATTGLTWPLLWLSEAHGDFLFRKNLERDRKAESERKREVLELSKSRSLIEAICNFQVHLYSQTSEPLKEIVVSDGLFERLCLEAYPTIREQQEIEARRYVSQDELAYHTKLDLSSFTLNGPITPLIVRKSSGLSTQIKDLTSQLYQSEHRRTLLEHELQEAQYRDQNLRRWIDDSITAYGDARNGTLWTISEKPGLTDTHQAKIFNPRPITVEPK